MMSTGRTGFRRIAYLIAPAGMVCALAVMAVYTVQYRRAKAEEQERLNAEIGMNTLRAFAEDHRTQLKDGWTALSAKRFLESEQRFKAALKAASMSNRGIPDSRSSDCLMGLAEVRLAERRYEEAQKFYEAALRDRESALGPDATGTAEALERYAPVLRIRKKLAEAARIDKRARTIRARNHVAP